jgi:N-acetylglucosamine-6-phosphate deacetylase
VSSHRCRPGFVDLQVNGVGDVDFWRADPAGWRRAGRLLARHGVTHYCPTLVSAPLAAYPAALDRVAAAQAAAGPGEARIVGAHLEGPFLGAAPGAHPRELLRRADPGWLAGLLDRHPGLVRIVTLAPEADPGLETVAMLAERGVLVALGHSGTDADTADAAFAAGARLVTHLFNGMAPLRAREPGLVGAALDHPEVRLGLIADGAHVHPRVLRLVFRCAPGRVCVVTDQVGMPPPAATPGGPGPPSTLRDAVDDGPVARLADGTLAGSRTPMDAAIRVLVGAGVPVAAALAAAGPVPAALLGVAEDAGEVELDPDGRLVRVRIGATGAYAR